MPQFELHLICRKRHLPLKGKTKGHSGKLLCRADVAREFPGLLRSSEPGKKLSTALMLREATMVSSAPSIPGSRNMRIRRCAKAPLKNIGGGEEGGDVCDLAVLEGKLDAHSAFFRAAGVKAAVGHFVSRIE